MKQRAKGQHPVHENPARPTIHGLPIADALDLIAQLVDHAGDNRDSDLANHSLILADELEGRGIQPTEMVLLDYFRANAWACLYQQRIGNRTAVWDFEQPEVRKQVFLLRRAAFGPGFCAVSEIHRCQIFTNLGNQLDTLGRFIEARASWRAALEINPNFWMARANRGYALMHYANSLYDSGHQDVFALHAHRDLTEAVSQVANHPDLGDTRLRVAFSRHAEQIGEHFDIDEIAKNHKPDNWPMGNEPAERNYRKWCLNNILFLNPLNDVDCASIAANDVMGLPTFTTKINTPPVEIGMYNELKQGFASARWMLWEGTTSPTPHFSDRDLSLINTLDSPAYGLATEKVKIAFRIAYSLLDKVAYFLNHYLNLKIPENRVSFRTIWREKDNGPMRAHFTTSENWPLRGLFWLSKDLFEEGMRDSTEPEARKLSDLRNHLEHKYVKVHEFLLPSSVTPTGPFYDTLAHSVDRVDLERRTLRLIQLVRSALIYLSLSMHHEERNRAKSGKAVPMSLDIWRDEWER